MSEQETRQVPVREPAERVTVDFTGEGSGVDEMSWGMWEIWHAMVDQRSSLPIGGRMALPAGTTVAGVAEELRYLMSRFPSMRTLLRFDAAGWPTQELFGSGSTTLEVYDAGDGDPDEVADQVEQHYRATDFAYATEWPVRMGMVRRDGMATHLISIMNHLVTDAVGGAIMLREVQERSTAPVTGLQPLEQAGWQRSPAGQRQNGKALRHWERVLGTIPARRFPPVADQDTPRHRVGLFESRALRLAVPLIAERTGTDTQTVLQALYAVALRRINVTGPVVVRPVVNNRFRSDLSDVVCMVAQAGISVLDIGDSTVDEVVELTRRGALATFKHAYFHPEKLNELIARVSADRGERVDVQCFLNDRTSNRPPEEGTASDTEELARQLRKAREDSGFRWTHQTEDTVSALYVAFDDLPDALLMEVQTNTHYFSSNDAEALAFGVEALAVEAALDPGTRTGPLVGDGPAEQERQQEPAQTAEAPEPAPELLR
ncbi:condensation domain-containing protein [Kitasatospora sp. NBC_00240]|uniref:condensation domain-containing protein n=1 Tax=Kitasatospora sp. NBC_00240 TaxID=2903567 RepID=UPI00224D1EB4|nr:condensation domain-containing protein [Kitasatospora sp. NBC_00240]MCX5215064.1 condensation domain-containing protein [Kitasatospora sp. NBC_00240]